ncbi:hypothetical protein [Timonella sp. A28]|uniref:hypothetical protein n=1 Tax=Timonella sp. A28 TaxID=3442640 RepID=UPI003EB9B60E
MKKTWKILVSEVGYARIITPYAAGIFCTLSFLQTSSLITYVGVFVFFSAVVYNVFLIKRFHFLNRRKEKWKKINLSGRKIVLKDFVKINSNVLYGTGRRKGHLLYMVMIYKNKGKATLYTRRVEHKDRIFEEHFF